MLRHLESFDYAADEGYFDRYYTRTGTLGGVAAVPPGREQGIGASSDSNTALVLTTPALSAVSNTWIQGIGVYWGEIQTGLTTFQGLSFMSGASEQVAIDFIPANTDAGSFVLVQARRGVAILGTSVLGAMTPTFWYYVEVKSVVRTGANGSIEVKVGFRNSPTVTVLTLTGINTANTGVDGADRMRIRWSTSGTALANRLTYDDWYVCDSTGAANNDFLGPTTVLGFIPNGTGNTMTWSLAGGAASVQDALDDPANTQSVGNDDTRITADTVGQIALASYPNHTYLGNTTIRGIMVRSTAGMDTTGTRTIKHRLRNTTLPAETDGVSSFVLAGTTWVEYTEVFETDPNTAAAWTKAGLDGLEIGTRVSA